MSLKDREVYYVLILLDKKNSKLVILKDSLKGLIHSFQNFYNYYQQNIFDLYLFFLLNWFYEGRFYFIFYYIFFVIIINLFLIVSINFELYKMSL